MSSASSRSKVFACQESGGDTRSASTDSGVPQYFSLRWNNHPVNLVSGFSGLFNSEKLVDVTLAAEGRQLMAHKMLLSACSDYFQSLFSLNPCRHPIVILKDVAFEDLHAVVQFMYNGIVNVSSDRLPTVLKTADTLQIKGLGEKYSESLHSLMGQSSSRTSSIERRQLSRGESGSGNVEERRSFSSSRLLSVPSQHSIDSRQLSTESLPEYPHRSRDVSPRQHSDESIRQHSLESASLGIGQNRIGFGGQQGLKRSCPSPPTSQQPQEKQYTKKFRQRSGAESSCSDRGNSMEEDKSSLGLVTARVPSPPTIHVSPSRQSSSSTEHEGANVGGTVVAKKKRELFSARSSRSGGSNQSSNSEHAKEHSFTGKRLDSSGSSGQSGEQSQEEAAHAGNPPTSVATALTVPSTSSAVGPLNRTQSAGSDGSSTSHSSSKKSRFLLRRQDCLEKGEVDLVRSSTTNPLLTPFHGENVGLGPPSPPPSDPLELTTTEVHPSPKTATMSTLPKPRMMGLISGEQSLPPAPPGLAIYSPPNSSSIGHQAAAAAIVQYHGGLEGASPFPASVPCSSPKNISSLLPLSTQEVPSLSGECTKLVIDTDSPIARSSTLSSVGGSSLLRPGCIYRPRSPPPIMTFAGPEFHHSTEQHRFPSSHSQLLGLHHPVSNVDLTSQHLRIATNQSPISSSTGLTSPSLAYPLTSSSSSSLAGGSLVPNLPEQFGHCPKPRDGPALGCNYCWNTTDVNGRILRRKTKYHCPDCQANLCIVPCFQAYHEAMEKEKPVSTSVATN